MTVFSGMLAATVMGVLIIPALYVMVERLTGRDKPGATPPEQAAEHAE